MTADQMRRFRAPPPPRHPRPRLPRGRLRGRLPFRWRRDPVREAVSVLGGILRRTGSRLYLRFDETEHCIDGIARRPPFRHAGREHTLPLVGGAVVLSRRTSITCGAMCLHQTLALQAAEQWVDRPLTDDRETAGTQSLRHLVTVGGPLLHHGQKAEVEDSAKQLSAALLTTCHASQGSSNCLAPQVTARREVSSASPAASTARAHGGSG